MLRDLGHRALGWFYEKSTLIAYIATIVLTVTDISNVDDWKFDVGNTVGFQAGKLIYSVSLFFAVAAGTLGLERSATVKSLETSLSESQTKIADLETSLGNSLNSMSGLFESYLALIVNTLGFGSAERISVYKVKNDEFVLIGRHSTNPVLKRKNRLNYPIDEGFISKGWEEGKYFVDGLPQITRNSTGKDFDGYHKAVSAIAPIGKEVVARMKMRSRTYYVYRISDRTGEPQAIFVAESEKEKAFTEEGVNDVLKGVEQALILFIETNNGETRDTNALGL